MERTAQVGEAEHNDEVAAAGSKVAAEGEADAESEANAVTHCTSCGLALTEAELRHLNWQPACDACVARARAAAAAEVPDARSYALAVAGGLGGALIGGAIWAAIAIITDLEIGYVAILVGVLAGLGVMHATRGKRSQVLQVLAAGLAVVGLVLAKLFIIAWYVRGALQEAGADLGLFDAEVLSFIVETLPQTLTPYDALWTFIAVGAAYRFSTPTQANVQ